MAQMSSLIGFWNSKTEEAEKRNAGNVFKKDVKIEKLQYKEKTKPLKVLPVFKIDNIVNDDPIKTEHSYSDNRISDADASEANTKKSQRISDNLNGLSSSSSCTSLHASPRNTTRSREVSPFTKFRELESAKSGDKGFGASPPAPSRMTSLFRNSSLPPSQRPTITHKQLASPPSTVRAGSGAKEIILTWVQETIKNYPIPMSNFSSCWSNGLAFCALIHAFYPTSFVWSSLVPANREYNFNLAFVLSEQLAGISPLLEVEDMVKYTKPDWKCVFTYVQSFYRRFRNTQPPNKTQLKHTVQEENTKEDIKEDTQEDTKEDYEGEYSHKPIVTDTQDTISNTSLSPTSAVISTNNNKSCRSISLCSGKSEDKAEKERKYSFNPSIAVESLVTSTRQ